MIAWHRIRAIPNYTITSLQATFSLLQHIFASQFQLQKADLTPKCIIDSSNFSNRKPQISQTPPYLVHLGSAQRICIQELRFLRQKHKKPCVPGFARLNLPLMNPNWGIDTLSGKVLSSILIFFSVIVTSMKPPSSSSFSNRDPSIIIPRSSLNILSQ